SCLLGEGAAAGGNRKSGVDRHLVHLRPAARGDHGAADLYRGGLWGGVPPGAESARTIQCGVRLCADYCSSDPYPPVCAAGSVSLESSPLNELGAPTSRVLKNPRQP